MSDTFENMIINLNYLLDAACSELDVSYQVEEVYSAPTSSGYDVAGVMDSVVGHLLDASSQGMSTVVYLQKVAEANTILRCLLTRLKAEQSTEISLTSPASGEIRGEVESDEEPLVDLPAFKRESSNRSNACVPRKGATVVVEMDHDSETNFFTDLSAEITRGGVFIATYNILKEGTPLNVQLSLPCGRSFPLQGSVSWVREYENCAEGASPGMGIALGQLSAELRAAINRYMRVRPPLFFEMA